NRPKTFINQIMNVRRKIETVIGQLTERFNIQKIKAKDTWHLLSKIRRKICSHTIAVFIGGSTIFNNIIS
ncbi:MAG: IS982 family transposase, partial [Holosporaceae bacterium]|nr:IS982 family transposase [Holosporaceae bacterium]